MLMPIAMAMAACGTMLVPGMGVIVDMMMNMPVAAMITFVMPAYVFVSAFGMECAHNRRHAAALAPGQFGKPGILLDVDGLRRDLG